MPNLFAMLNTKKVLRHEDFKIDYSKVRLLEHTDIEKREIVDFKRYITKFRPKKAFKAEEAPRPDFGSQLQYLKDYSPRYYPKGRYVVAVRDTLYPKIQAALTQYVKDVANDGYYAVVYKISNGKPSELRSFLADQGGICGALLVGDLPVAWFEMDDDFNGSHAEFPCDLYYMDLNGTWTDADGDGKFSAHPDKVEPEIWVARLWTPTMDGNDAAMLNDYFARNHRFRKGLLGVTGDSLAYVDDDWQGFGDCGLPLAVGTGAVDSYTDPATTDGDKYKAEMNQQRAWAQICAHSSPSGHSFKVPGASSEWVGSTYLRDQNPPNAFFYNLFACSNARFVEADYMAGWYLFEKAGMSRARGLAVVGSTKTGSMLYFENFYRPMGGGKTVGEAYKEWWSTLGPEHDLGERQWFYGMTLLGDPTLNWWSGVVPALRTPDDGAVFDHFPRETHFVWDPVAVSGVSYCLEIDYFYKKWMSEVGNTLLIQDIHEPHRVTTFVGGQPGRFRVRAKLPNGILCPWSDWRTFRYTK